MSVILFIIHILIICAISIIFLRYIFDWEELPMFDGSMDKEPLVSVIIPMRNEEKDIIQCLKSLMNQTYKNMEMIIIDDCSEDTSKELVQNYIHDNRSRHIHLISVDSLPTGWVGKCHAITKGIEKARGEWFLFTDADVIFNPQTVRSTVWYALDTDAGFISLKFKKICISFWEKVIVPYAYFYKGWIKPSPSRIADMNNPDATATGDFIFMSRTGYISFGGHAHPQVKNHFIEDACIARVAKKNNITPVILDGKNHIAVRKFNSLRQIFLGLGKIVPVEFLHRSWFLLFCHVACMAVYSIIPFVLLLIVRDPLLVMLNAFICCVTMGVYVFYLHTEKHPLYYSLFMPLGAFMLIVVFIQSFVQVYFNIRVNWRGRIYQDKYDG